MEGFAEGVGGLIAAAHNKTVNLFENDRFLAELIQLIVGSRRKFS
jgi:hypothetical protein